jgi:hypothetical protein
MMSIPRPAPRGPVTDPSLPHAHAYRVGGARLIAGEYPFSRDRDLGRARLRAHLEAGITAFLDLTERGELEPYAGDLLAEARALGTDAVHERRPIRVLEVPPPGGIVGILDALDALLADGHTVYLHGRGGVGRTGLVVACHLVGRGLTGRAALAEVEALFSGMAPAKVARHRWTGSPETPEQREFVLRRGTQVRRAVPDAGVP